MEGNNKNDAEEEKEVGKAALLLYSWKFLELDPIEAQALEEQKQETLEQIRSQNHHQAMPPEIGQPNNNNPGSDNNNNNNRAINPPRLPPVLAPNGLIGESEKESTESDVKDDQ